MRFGGTPRMSFGARPSFGGAPRMSSFGTRPSVRPSVTSRQTLRSVTPSVRPSTAFNRPSNRSSGNRITQASRPKSGSVNPTGATRTAQQNGLNGRTDHIYQRQAATSHPEWDRRRPYYSNNHWWAYNGYDWIGLDEGYFPWDYYPYYTYDYYPYDYFIDDPTDVPPPYQGTTSVAPAPDPMVTAAQRDLAQLGYYSGPVDGLFGPTTRDAVARYQTDKNLSVTGSLTADTLQALGLPKVAANSTPPSQ